ncbi:hypothetical protein C0Q70_01642 [Pomacea canaliculata]|uniref:Uncharacterized protein n=1 Tax=Pomacea canaliculata TaxID=400727 RepID=A0A2T7Q011_POMCA|nr:hypothetical protein C0Q70_01642 [Pomacea canaliculata]
MKIWRLPCELQNELHIHGSRESNDVVVYDNINYRTIDAVRNTHIHLYTVEARRIAVHQAKF